MMTSNEAEKVSGKNLNKIREYQKNSKIVFKKEFARV